MDMKVAGAQVITEEEIHLLDEERQLCEVFTRVMGYHRPVQYFNIGKKGEYAERKFFTESKCSLRQ